MMEVKPFKPEGRLGRPRLSVKGVTLFFFSISARESVTCTSSFLSSF